jgi:hypothetical protein
MIRSCFIFLSITRSTIKGHALLTKPSSKNGGNIATPDQDSAVHFAIASYGIIDKAFFDGDHSETPWTKPGEFDFEMARDLISGHPQTLHPCGCNAGSVEHCAGVTTATGFGETTVGDVIIPPEWPKGSHQETAWNSWANHGGGYLYMLCKKSDFHSCLENYEGDDYLSCVWECFESKVLQFEPDYQKIQYKDNVCTYANMQPTEKNGKDDSIWRLTPIPDHLQVSNGGEGVCMWDSLIDFSNEEAESEFIASFGNDDYCDSGPESHSPSNWHVIDKVIVPNDLEEGEYLLSWRLDSYAADQMWTNCADVKIVSSSSSSFYEVECTPMPTSEPLEGTPTPMPVSTPV